MLRDTFRGRTVLQLSGKYLWNPVYSPTGHILFAVGDVFGTELWAVPFSLDRLEATGAPFLVDEDGTTPSLSASGTLVYSRVRPTGETQLVRVDRSGRELELLGESGAVAAARHAAEQRRSPRTLRKHLDDRFDAFFSLKLLHALREHHPSLPLAEALARAPFVEVRSESPESLCRELARQESESSRRAFNSLKAPSR